MTQKWQDDLENAFAKQKRKAIDKRQEIDTAERLFTQFIKQIARPALEEISIELKKYDRVAEIHDNGSSAVGITIKKQGQYGTMTDEFRYSIRLPSNALKAIPNVKFSWTNKQDHRPYESEDVICFNQKNIEHITRDDIIANFMKQYTHYVMQA